MISRTATKVGTEVIVERASFSLFHEQLAITPVEVQHKLRFRFLNVVALALFCDYLLLTLCVPILPSLFGDNYSAIEIGIVFASKPICQFLANPYMGSIVDIYGPKYPLLWGVIILALSTFLFAFGLSFKNDLPTAYAIVFVARSVQGNTNHTYSHKCLTVLKHRILYPIFNAQEWPPPRPCRQG